MERKYKAKIKELEKHLRVKHAQFEEENTQRLGVETQLRGRNIKLGKVVEEVASLKAQLKERDVAPIQIPLLECNECEKSIDQCRYLDGKIFQKDVVIRSLVQRRDQEETTKLFKEFKAWSLH